MNKLQSLYQKRDTFLEFGSEVPDSINVFSKMDNETEDIECTCGHSGDGHCLCCECSNEQQSIYQEIDEEEFINQLNDWD